MMKIKMNAIHVLVVWFMFLALGIGHAEEPKMPAVNQTYSVEKEERINQLAGFPVQTVYEILRAPDFF